MNEQSRLLSPKSLTSIIYISIVGFLFTSTSVGEPTRQHLQYKLACNYHLSHHQQCNDTQNQILVANYNQISAIVCQISSILGLANFGKLSDMFGRKPFMILIITSVLVSRCLLIYSYYIQQQFHMGIFLVCDFIASSMGGILGLTSLINSYISDSIDDDKRSILIGFGNGSIFAGEAFGPLLSNLLLPYLRRFDPRKGTELELIEKTTTVIGDLKLMEKEFLEPIQNSEFLILIIEISIFMMLLMYVVFIVPESTCSVNKNEEIWANMNWFNLKKPLTVLFTESSSTTKTTILFLIGLNCIRNMLDISLAPIYLQYAIYIFKWKPLQIGYFMSSASISKVLVLFIMSPLLFKYLPKLSLRKSTTKFDKVDAITLFMGILGDAICQFGISISNSTWSYIGFINIGSSNALINPTTSSVLLKYYPKQKTGQVFMALSLVSGLGCIVAPIISLNLYKLGLWMELPNLVFFGCLGLDLVLLLCLFGV